MPEMLVEVVFTVNLFSLILPLFALFKQGCFIIAEQFDRSNHALLPY